MDTQGLTWEDVRPEIREKAIKIAIRMEQIQRGVDVTVEVESLTCKKCGKDFFPHKKSLSYQEFCCRNHQVAYNMRQRRRQQLQERPAITSLSEAMAAMDSPVQRAQKVWGKG